MARTPAQRGKVGAWLVESRLARGWDTQGQARAEIARLTGWTIPQSVYAEWESGRRLPSDANLERLTAFYGERPTAEQAPDISAIAAAVSSALDRQTAALVGAIRERDAAIQELLQELATYRRQTLERQETERSLLEALPEALAIALGATPANGHAGGLPADKPPLRAT